MRGVGDLCGLLGEKIHKMQWRRVVATWQCRKTGRRHPAQGMERSAVLPCTVVDSRGEVSVNSGVAKLVLVKFGFLLM